MEADRATTEAASMWSIFERDKIVSVPNEDTQM